MISALAQLPPDLLTAPDHAGKSIAQLCSLAITQLGEAQSLDEVLAIRNQAEAFVVYTRKWRAAYDAQNACRLVVALAEAKIGAELTAAQARGEIAEHGANQHVRAADILPATLPEIGIPRQRAAEFRQLADLGEPAIREHVARANAEGRTVSRSSLLREAIRPAVEKAVALLARPGPQPSREPVPSIPTVEPLDPHWPDWTGAVETLATLPADLPAIARALPSSTPKLLATARRALPRLQAWVAELEALHV